MGKRQHQKDKMYLTSTEWVTLYGGKKGGPEAGDKSNYKRLPFDHCCLGLKKFKHPYCDPNGNIFELEDIVTYLNKYKKNPVTGEYLDGKSLIKLNFYKNSEGDYYCPVLYKSFTKQTHIVAIKTTGNVYSYEAVEELNIKNKNWRDLLNSKPFERKDIIIIQDPKDIRKFNIADFYHVKNEIKYIKEESDSAISRLKNINNEARAVLEELEETYKPSKVISLEDEKIKKKVADEFNAAHYSTGKVAASFTSTTLLPETIHEPAIIEEDVLRYEKIKKKGYVRLVTNMGHLNLELHCDIVPKVCENFIKLCQKGYYDNTKFHRSIRNFMIQGGDPTGRGEGGQSIWGHPFEDSFKPNLSHNSRGILSMANSGPNTNKSQFFITFRSCKHLDNKHSIFGKVVGGLDTLNTFEKIETDNKDRPIQDIIILKAQVFVDPFHEADEMLAKEREESKKLKEDQVREEKKKSAKPLKAFHSGIGKYINLAEYTKNNLDKKLEVTPKKKKITGYDFNFQNCKRMQQEAEIFIGLHA